MGRVSEPAARVVKRPSSVRLADCDRPGLALDLDLDLYLAERVALLSLEPDGFLGTESNVELWIVLCTQPSSSLRCAPRASRPPVRKHASN